MRCMESPNPTACLRHRPGLTHGPFPNHVAQTHVVTEVFEEQRNFASAGIRVRSKPSRSEFRQWLETAAIDLGLVRDVAAVPVRFVALSRLIFGKHPASSAVCQ